MGKNITFYHSKNAINILSYFFFCKPQKVEANFFQHLLPVTIFYLLFFFFMITTINFYYQFEWLAIKINNVFT